MIKHRLHNLLHKLWPAVRTVLTIQFIGTVFSAMCLFCSGCATGYLADRCHDGADIFTAAVGLGAGARARVGPLHAGLIYNLGDTGLRAGSLTESSGRCNPTEAELIGFSSEMLAPRAILGEKDNARCNAKGYSAESWVVPFVTTEFDPYYDTQARFPHPYWTQCEIQIGTLLSFRIGFNPGELLDFILGWTTIDIFNDDLEWKKRKSNQSMERDKQ